MIEIRKMEEASNRKAEKGVKQRHGVEDFILRIPCWKYMNLHFSYSISPFFAIIKGISFGLEARWCHPSSK